MKVSSIRSTIMLFLLCCVVIVAGGLMAGCAGDDGAQGAPGTNGNDGTDATLPLNGVPSPTENLQAQITSVVVSSTTGSLVVTFKLLDEKGAPLDPRNNITAGGRCRFFVAQIDATGNYKNYFLSGSGLPTYDPQSNPSASSAAASLYFAATATPGVYTFTFSKNITTDPMYDPTLTHTVAAQITRTITSSKGVVGFQQSVNPFINFRPDGNAVTVTREVAPISTCNECHGTLTGHGTRVEMALCILCHYPGVNDPDTGQSVDMKSMIHKIHMGSKLPSNVKGADYEIAGTSFKSVVFPYRTGDSFSNNTLYDCTKCHKAGKDAKGNTYGADVDKWKTNATREKCTTCHDTTTFDGSTTITVTTGAGLTTNLTATPHLGGTQADDALCVVCHSNADDKDYQSNSVPGAHLNPMNSTLNTGLTFSIISVQAVSGSTVTVQFVAKDGTGAPYTLIGGTAAGADAVTIAVSYLTGTNPEYDNTAATWRQFTASGTAETFIRAKTKTVSSTSVNPAAVYDVGSSSYIVSVGTITMPAGPGVGAISIYGSKLVIVPTLADKNLHRTASQHITRAYAPTAFWYFDLATGTQVTSASSLRRDVVSYDKCNACHTNIAIHSRPGTQLCVMCHAPNLYAKATAAYPDGSGNLKDMIHAIHGGASTTVFYGMNPVTAEMPNSVRNCLICHISAATAGLPLPTGGVKGSMKTGTTNTAFDGTAIPPIKAACTSCHDNAATAAHADLNTSAGVETCDVCHSSSSFLNNAHAPVR